MWQSLSSPPGYKSGYCLAVCPAGEDVLGPYPDDRKTFMDTVLRPLQDTQARQGSHRRLASPGEAFRAHRLRDAYSGVAHQVEANLPAFFRAERLVAPNTPSPPGVHGQPDGRERVAEHAAGEEACSRALTPPMTPPLLEPAPETDRLSEPSNVCQT
jgi:hypothetical protein